MQIIYDQLPEFFDETEFKENDEKDIKNGTATFKNLDKILYEDDEYQSEKMMSPEKDYSDMPLEQLPSTDKQSSAKHEKGFSICDIPKINMDKILNTKQDDYTIDVDYQNIMKTLDKDQNYNNRYGDDSGKYANYNNRLLNSNSKKRTLTENRTNRESDYSWNPKSKREYDDDEFLLNSQMLNTMKTQDMIKDLMELESNVVGKLNSSFKRRIIKFRARK